MYSNYIDILILSSIYIYNKLVYKIMKMIKKIYYELMYI